MELEQDLTCEKINGRKARSNRQQEIEPALFGETIENENTQPQTPNYKPQPDSCGECPACTKSNQLVHPDIHFSYPVITKKPGEKPISTDFIKEWREFIALNTHGNVYDWLQFLGAENKQGNITASDCNDIIRKLNLKSF